nr:hypothetical protein [Tanacetum cinerariifolium]
MDQDLGPENPPSPDYVPGPEHPPSPIEIPYVLEPKYPEYLAPSDDEAPLEDQPLPADASPTAASPGYMTDSDPEEDPEEEPFEEDDEEEEELPAPADSPVVPTVDLAPSAKEAEALEPDEPIHAPGSPISIPLSLTRLPRARKTVRLEPPMRCRVEQEGYGITDTWDEIVDKMMEIAPTTLEGVNERVTELDNTV